MEKERIKLKNPLSFCLKDNIKTENVIFNFKKDRYNQLITLLINDIYAKEDFEIQILSIENELESQAKEIKDLKRAEAIFLLRYLLLLYIKDQNGQSSKKWLNETVISLVKHAKEIDWYRSSEILGLAAFLTKNIFVNDIYRSFVLDGLINKLDNSIKIKDIIGISDLVIGIKDIPKRYFSEIEKIIIESELDKVKLERLSKLAIFYSEARESLVFNKIVSLLEDQLKRKFMDYIIPDIELSIYETLKLISTNLSIDEITTIIESLKTKGVSWATKIKNVDRDYVTTRLPLVARIPKFLPIEDVLSLLALRSLNIEELYYLKNSEYQIFLDGLVIKKEGFGTINKKHISISLNMSLFILSVIAIITLCYRNYKEVNTIFSEFRKLKLDYTPFQPLFNTIKTVSNLFIKTPFTVLLFTIIFVTWYLIRLNNAIIINRRFTIKSLWKACPVIPNMFSTIRKWLG